MRSGQTRRGLRLTAVLAVVVALVAAGRWLLIKGTRGAEIATVLALLVAFLSLLAAVVAVVVAVRSPDHQRRSNAFLASVGVPRIESSAARPWRTAAVVGVAAAASVCSVVAAIIVTGQGRGGSGHRPTLTPELPAASRVHTKALQRAGSAPLDIAAATDGAAWFTEFENNKTGHVTASGDIREFDKTRGSRLVHPYAIAAGLSGDAWFTEGVPADDSRPSGNRIGHITAEGIITTHPIRTANAGAVGITVSADGVVWFTEQRAGQIGRLNRDGSVDEFPIGRTSGGSSWSDQITFGPDGNLWFTEFSANKIGQMTAAGTLIREYELSRGETGPVDIIARGNELWFTVIDGKQIGRLDPASGAIQWVDVPTSGDHGPASLAEDHGHAGVWFTELSDAAVSYVADAQPTKIDPRYTLPTGSQPVGIAVGPDGTVWFTERLGNEIGWISTS